MKRVLQLQELDALAIGATFLGSGGGGDPASDLLRTKEIFMRHGPCQLIDLQDLAPDDLVVPVAFMGAPLVSTEKLPSGKEFLALLKMIKEIYKKEPKALVAAEIGGSNAFVPLALGAETGLPVLDADSIGRAFPELHMSSCNLAGISCSPAFLADSQGDVVMIKVKSPKRLEQYARALCEAMGSSVACAFNLLTAEQAAKALVLHTISLGIELGIKLQNRSFQPTLLGTGVLVDIQQDIQGGFLCGKAKIASQEGQYEVEFQNEYLLAKSENEVLATTPDIIAIIEQESGLPLAVERLKFGLRVDLVAVAAPKVWQSKKALQIVGPRAFGYDVDYREVSS